MTVYRVGQNNFTGGVIGENTIARNDLQKYANGVSKLVNGVIRPQGGIVKRPGLRFVGAVNSPNGRAIPFIYNREQAYVIYFDSPLSANEQISGSVCKIFKDGELFATCDSPYAFRDVKDLSYAQCNDVMYLAHEDYQPRKLMRELSTDGVVFSFALVDYEKGSATPPLTVTATVTAMTYSTAQDKKKVKQTIYYAVAAVVDGVESEPSTAVAVNDVFVEWPENATIALSWSAVTGADKYVVYKRPGGSLYYGWIGESDTTSFTDTYISPDTSVGPKKYNNPFASESNPESGLNAYPSVVALHQQRLVWAASQKEPSTVWLSESGDFESMALHEPQVDSDAITATIASSRLEKITGIVSLSDAVILTTGAEISMTAMDGKALTPTSIAFKPQSYYGSKKLDPVFIGRKVLSVLASGRTVRDIGYELSTDSYTGQDISILADSLLDSPIISWTYAQFPFPVVYCVLENGGCCAMTYMPETEVIAWSEIQTPGGAFASVCAVPNDDTTDVYFSLKRTVSGTSANVIELMRFPKSPDEDYVYLDGCKVVSGDGVETVPGIPASTALYGNQLKVLADGVSVSADLAPVDETLFVYGDKIQLRAVIEPASAYSNRVAWTASAGASVTEDGLVTIATHDECVVTVTATTTDGSNLSGTITLAVEQTTSSSGSSSPGHGAVSRILVGIGVEDLATYQFGRTERIAVGFTKQATAYYVYEDGHKALITSGLTWTRAVADGTLWPEETAASSTVTGVTKGAWHLYARCRVDGVNYWHRCSYVVIDPVDVTRIDVSVDAQEIQENEETDATAVVVPSDATVKTVTWSISPNSVATINSSTGHITAVAPGRATVTATSTRNTRVSGTAVIDVISAPILASSVTVSGAEHAVMLGHECERAVVGIPYALEVETLDPEIKGQNGLQTAEKRIVLKSILNVRNTRGMKVGPDASHMYNVLFANPGTIGQAPPLCTGEYENVFAGQARTKAVIRIVQDEPYPCTIEALTIHVAMETK